MMFSEKRASKRIKSMLVVANDHATSLKGLDDKRLVVGEFFFICEVNQLFMLAMQLRHG